MMKLNQKINYQMYPPYFFTTIFKWQASSGIPILPTNYPMIILPTNLNLQLQAIPLSLLLLRFWGVPDVGIKHNSQVWPSEC